jgi:hypothetical protein
MATTKSWSVHYETTGVVSKVPLLYSGDAGPTAGTQEVLVGKGATAEDASLIVVGGLTYLKGNVLTMEDLAGLSATQAAETAGKWVVFSTTNSDFTQIVAGVRSKDVATEMALDGPYTLGQTTTLDGHRVDAIMGTQKGQNKNVTYAVMYVQASGRHLIVGEDTATRKGVTTGADDTVFSKWGEKVRPKAPTAALTLGSISAT